MRALRSSSAALHASLQATGTTATLVGMGPLDEGRAFAKKQRIDTLLPFMPLYVDEPTNGLYESMGLVRRDSLVDLWANTMDAETLRSAGRYARICQPYAASPRHLVVSLRIRVSCSLTVRCVPPGR